MDVFFGVLAALIARDLIRFGLRDLSYRIRWSRNKGVRWVHWRINAFLRSTGVEPK